LLDAFRIKILDFFREGLPGCGARRKFGAIGFGMKSVLKTHAGKLQEFGFGKAHAACVGIFLGEICVKHSGIVRGKGHGNAAAKEQGKRVMPHFRVRALKEFRESSGAEIARGTYFEDDTPLGEEVHEIGVVNGGDAMADALDAEELDGFADGFRAPYLAGMDQFVKTQTSRAVVNGPESRGRKAQFIAPDAKGDNGFRVALASRFDDLHGSIHAELPDGIENPIDLQASMLKRFGSAEKRFEVFFGGLLAEQHDPDGQSHLGIYDLLGKKVLTKINSNEGIIPRVAKEGSNPLERFQEAKKIGVSVMAAYFLPGEDNAVTRGQSANRRRLDGAFKMQVEFSLWHRSEGLRGWDLSHFGRLLRKLGLTRIFPGGKPE
jgi:hypothetical protein